MQVIRKGEAPERDVSDRPIFTGGIVTSQSLVSRDTSKNHSVGIVSFAAGARNIFHTHTSDQVLFVTSGKGIVATEEGEEVVAEGDAILIPAGEKHWHGATSDSDFSHMSILAADSQTELFP